MSVLVRVRFFAAKATKAGASAASKATAASAAAPDAVAGAAAETAKKPKSQRKAFDFASLFTSAPPFKLAGESDTDYPAWLAHIQAPRPALRDITPADDAYTKLSRRVNIKAGNQDQPF